MHTCLSQVSYIYYRRNSTDHSLSGATTHAGSWLTQEVASIHLYPWRFSSNFWLPASLHPSSLPDATTHAGSWPTQEVASNHLYPWLFQFLNTINSLLNFWAEICRMNNRTLRFYCVFDKFVYAVCVRKCVFGTVCDQFWGGYFEFYVGRFGHEGSFRRVFFKGWFTKLRKASLVFVQSVHLAVTQLATTRHPLAPFSCHFILGVRGGGLLLKYTEKIQL